MCGPFVFLGLFGRVGVQVVIGFLVLGRIGCLPGSEICLVFPGILPDLPLPALSLQLAKGVLKLDLQPFHAGSVASMAPRGRQARKRVWRRPSCRRGSLGLSCLITDGPPAASDEASLRTMMRNGRINAARRALAPPSAAQPSSATSAASFYCVFLVATECTYSGSSRCCSEERPRTRDEAMEKRLAAGSWRYSPHQASCGGPAAGPWGRSEPR